MKRFFNLFYECSARGQTMLGESLQHWGKWDSKLGMLSLSRNP